MKTKNTKKVISVLVLVLIMISRFYGLTYDELLQNYCNQDIQFEELAISYQQAELSHRKTQIDNGVEFSASTGSIKIEFADNQVNTSLSPSISVKIPSLSNTEAKISVPISIEEDVSMQNAGISLSTEIISSSKANRELTLEKSLRSVEEAQRKLTARIVALEKAFLNELKNLYSLGLDVYEAEEDLLTKQISFEGIKLQGYSTTSPKYRSSQLSVKSAEYDLEKAKRKYSNSLEKFLAACGATELDIYSLEIPETELLKITDFPKNKFSAIENVVWSNYLNSTSRNNKKDFTLSANTSANFSLMNETMSSTIGAGLTAAFKGISGNMNFSFPTNDKSNPSVSFSLSWNPNQSKLASISEETSTLQEQQEVLSLKKAEESYTDTVNEYETNRENLLWQYEKNLEEETMYKELAEDTQYWYNEGIVSESEYRQANSNYAKAILSVTSSKIDQLIYNLDLKSLFVE
ncbi:MAG: hypothetical protein J6A14_02745 [Spirochaetaceae bacterium]|nr:hypothetical protein [Spirochaetaceae bacterium]